MGIVGWECVYTMYIDSWSWLQWLTLGTMPMEEWFQWLGFHVDQSFLLLITVYIYICMDLVEARSIENPKRWIITCSMIRHDQFGARQLRMATWPCHAVPLGVPWLWRQPGQNLSTPAFACGCWRRRNVPVTPSPWCRKRASCVAWRLALQWHRVPGASALVWRCQRRHRQASECTGDVDMMVKRL